MGCVSVHDVQSFGHRQPTTVFSLDRAARSLKKEHTHRQGGTGSIDSHHDGAVAPLLCPPLTGQARHKLCNAATEALPLV